MRSLPFIALLSALAAPAQSAGYQQQRFQCPNLGIANCTANDGLAFFDGCKVIACIGWRSAATDPAHCPPARGLEELAECRRLGARLARMQNSEANPETLVACPEFAGVDFCLTADAFFGYHDGCDYHLCDGSGGALERTKNTCPKAATPQHLFYCAANFNSVAKMHNSKHACSDQINNADRICEVMWPGYRFGDNCFGSNDFVCGPGGRLLTRPSPRLCSLLGASQSIKCREVAREVANLLSETSGFTCPELHFTTVCTDENRGFVYNDGCNRVLCDGKGSGMTEGHVCKLPFSDTQSGGRQFCASQAASERRRAAESRRHTAACLSPAEACPTLDSVGDSYFNGCAYCTCLGVGRAQCTKRHCQGFYGTAEEFATFCASVTHRLP